jgi:sec-independent protein translocase protein TatA
MLIPDENCTGGEAAITLRAKQILRIAAATVARDVKIATVLRFDNRRPSRRADSLRGGVVTMGRIGMPELLIILAIIIVIFGANRLPGLGKGIGSAIRNFKDGMKDEAADHKS